MVFKSIQIGLHVVFYTVKILTLQNPFSGLSHSTAYNITLRVFVIEPRRLQFWNVSKLSFRGIIF